MRALHSVAVRVLDSTVKLSECNSGLSNVSESVAECSVAVRVQYSFEKCECSDSAVHECVAECSAAVRVQYSFEK